MGLGPYAGVEDNSLVLIVISVVSYPPRLKLERGGMRKISPISKAYLHLSAIF
jgi:hypothetical protein